MAQVNTRPTPGLLVALGMTLASVAYTIYGLRYSFGTLDHPETAFFPRIVGMGWVALSLVGLLNEWRAVRPGSGAAAAELQEDPVTWRSLALCGAVALYLMTVNWLGHTAALVLCLAATVFVSRVDSWLGRIGVIVLTVLFLYLVFQKWLWLPLPRGILGF